MAIDASRKQKGTLQWGRDQLIAEFVAGFTAAVTTNMLQWGRDQLIAEFRPHLDAPQGNPDRFNGAAIN